MTRATRETARTVGAAMLEITGVLHGDPWPVDELAEYCDAFVDSFDACDDHEYWPADWLPLPRHRIAQLTAALADCFTIDPADPDMLRRHRKFLVPPRVRDAAESASAVSQLGSAHATLAATPGAASSGAHTHDLRVLDELYATREAFEQWVDAGDMDEHGLRRDMGEDVFDEADLQVVSCVPDLDRSAQLAIVRFAWEAGADLDSTDEEWDAFIDEGIRILASVWAQGVSITETPAQLMARLDVAWANDFPSDPTEAAEWEAARLWKFRPSPFLLQQLAEGRLAEDYVEAALALADWADDRIIAEAPAGLTGDFALYEALLRWWETCDVVQLSDAMYAWPDEVFADGGPFDGRQRDDDDDEGEVQSLGRRTQQLLAEIESLAPGTTAAVNAITTGLPYRQATDNATGRCYGCGKSGMVANRYCRGCMRGEGRSANLVTFEATAPAPTGVELDLPGQPALREWQRQALQAWSAAGGRGVVQAVTGTGKTRVGLQAAAAHLAAGGQVLVLVPTRALLNQWDRQLVTWFGRTAVGRLGDGHHDTFRTHDVLVATPHSARKGTGFRSGGLLIADECHRYGSETWSTALDERFERRLGLTATYERQDDGDELLADYFGGKPVFDIDYRRAIDESVVSPFRLAFVGVDLGREDKTAYDALDEACRRAAGKLINEFGLPAQPFGEFMKAVARAADGEDGGPAQRAAWTYTSSFAKRRALLADTPAKLARLAALEPAVAKARGTLVFTQTKAAAQSAATLFARMGHPSAAIWGELDGAEREHLLQAFRQGDRTVLSAPRVLDEGIDVPDADLGIVVSASSGRRQMIQRMGRVLRMKTDGRYARLVILYAAGTSEDPGKGAHEGFIDLAWDVAAAHATFPPSASPATICRFLETGR